jgi:hypothetical protein
VRLKSQGDQAVVHALRGYAIRAEVSTTLSGTRRPAVHAKLPGQFARAWKPRLPLFWQPIASSEPRPFACARRG